MSSFYHDRNTVNWTRWRHKITAQWGPAPRSCIGPCGQVLNWAPHLLGPALHMTQQISYLNCVPLKPIYLPVNVVLFRLEPAVGHCFLFAILEFWLTKNRHPDTKNKSLNYFAKTVKRFYCATGQLTLCFKLQRTAYFSCVIMSQNMYSPQSSKVFCKVVLCHTLFLWTALSPRWLIALICQLARWQKAIDLTVLELLDCTKPSALQNLHFVAQDWNTNGPLRVIWWRQCCQTLLAQARFSSKSKTHEEIKSIRNIYKALSKLARQAQGKRLQECVGIITSK